MLRVFLVVVVLAGLYYYLRSDDNNPEVIDNPVYAEIRVNLEEQGRTFKFVLFGEMAGQTDCAARAAIVWTKALSSCGNCQFLKTDCRPDMPIQYQKMFENTTLDTTYLSAQRGTRFERNGRMVIWGLTGNESVQVCELMKKTMKQNYAGDIRCIKGSG